MDREFRIAIVLVGLIAAWFTGLVLHVRYIVPSILEARFTGSLFVAVVVGVAGVLFLAWLVLLIIRWARRALGR